MSSPGTTPQPIIKQNWTFCLSSTSSPERKSPRPLIRRISRVSLSGPMPKPYQPPAPRYPGVMLKLPEGLLDKPTSIAEKPERKTRNRMKLSTPVGPYQSPPKIKEILKRLAGKTPGQQPKKVSYTLTLRTNRRHSRRYSTSTIWGHQTNCRRLHGARG